MNFSLVSPNDVNFNKIMMQKHLEQKKQRKYHLSENIQPCISQDLSRISLSESLPLAGQKLLESNQIKEYNNLTNGSPANVREKRKKYSNEEQQKIKEAIKRDLTMSVMEEKIRKAKEDEERRKVGVEMSKQNGILDYLQKQIDKRNNFIKMCLVKQEARKKNFYDQDYRKHCQVLQHIHTNFDPDVFNHISDKYQQQQKINFQKMLQTNHNQAELNKSTRLMERSEYGKYFDEKYRRQKHNPITNPLQYHIDNPCIKKYISLN